MNKLRFFTFVILLLTLSCEEDTLPTFIKGSVSDFYNKNEIANINLRIYDNTLDQFNHQLRQPYDTTSFVSKILVDNFGNFEFETESLKKGRDYILVYNDLEKFSIYSNKIEVEKNNTFNLKLKNYKTLKIKIENFNYRIDSFLLFVEVDKSHYSQTGEIVEFLFNDTINLSDNLNRTILINSIPECLHRITYKYCENENYFRNVTLSEYILNVDTTEIQIRLF